MPETFSQLTVLAIFYTVFLGQIFLLSVYFPGKIIRRARYVLANFPPEDYPRLYPTYHPGFMAEASRKLGFYKGVNAAIAVFGLMILTGMLVKGYQPNMKGGDEIFVLFYSLLQAIPLIYVELREFRQFRLMRSTYAAKVRKADLAPRRLFDFISPLYVILAVVLYGIWLTFFLSVRGFDDPQVEEVYATLVLITGMNLAYAGWIARVMYGKKLDPYKAQADQIKQIGVTIKTFVFSSIGISVFLMLMQAADQYDFEVFDPPLASLYIQFCMVFSLGIAMKMQSLDDIDFDVYRDEKASLPKEA